MKHLKPTGSCCLWLEVFILFGNVQACIIDPLTVPRHTWLYLTNTLTIFDTRHVITFSVSNDAEVLTNKLLIENTAWKYYCDLLYFGFFALLSVLYSMSCCWNPTLLKV